MNGPAHQLSSPPEWQRHSDRRRDTPPDGSRNSSERKAWLDSQRQAFEAALNGEPLDVALGILVRAVIDAIGQDARAGFYLANKEGTALHHIVGMPPEYAEAVDGFKVGPDSIACGLATATGKPVLTTDVREDRLWQPWLWMAEKFDYRACWSFPIQSLGGAFHGTLAVYSRHPREATERDIEIGTFFSRTASILIARHKESEARRLAELALRESDERFRDLADSAPAMLWVTDPDGSCTFLSRGWYEYTGQSEENALGFGWLDAVHPDDRAQSARIFLDANRRQKKFSIDYRVRRADGKYRWAIDAGTPHFDASGAYLGYVGSVIDVHERKNAELERIAHARVLEMIASEQPLKDVLTELVHLVEQQVSGAVGSILLIDDDGEHLRHGAAPGLPSDYNDAIDGVRIGPVVGSCGTAAYRGQRVIVEDIQSSPLWADYRDLASQHGLRACWSEPIRSMDGRSLGTSAIYFTEPRKPTEEELSVLQSVARFAGIAIDRRRAQEALRRSARTFAMLVEQSPLGIYTVDADFRVANVSVGAHPAFRNVQPVIGRDFAEVMHTLWPEKFADEAIRIFRHTLETGEPYVSPGLTEKRKDLGQVESYEWQINRVTLVDGRPGVVCYFFDATRIQQVNRALRESEARFHMLADNMAQLAWTCDETLGNVTWCNQRWLEYTGLSIDDLKGWGWRRCYHPDHVERVAESVKRASEAGELWEDTFPLRRKDGEYRWFLSRAVPIRDESGKIVRWFGTNTDITAERDAHAELTRHREHLQQLVEERTAELEASHQQLRLSERMASLGTLSAGLGHDMGNLLVPVRVSLETLDEMQLPPEAQAEIAGIKSSADYLRKLASGLRLLAVDPARGGKTEPTGLLSWWAEAATVLKNALPRGVTLEARLPDEECQVAMHRTALTQAIFNLVQNAGDAMGSGGGKVSITAEMRDDAVRLMVSDNGPGMNDEVRRRCMEPFFTTKSRGLSTGLGLALVYGLLRESDGSLTIDSTPGQGSTFTLNLPRFKAKAPTSPRRRTASVSLADTRLKAIVAAELRSLSYDVDADFSRAAEADLIIADQPTPVSNTHAPVLLLTDKNLATASAIAIGSKPSVQALRESIRELASRAPCEPVAIA